MDAPPPPPPSNADPHGDPEQAILELLQSMETYRPVVHLSQVNNITSKKIPDAVLDYYLLKSGFNCQDIRVKRLLGLAAQKFVSDVAADAYKFHAIREQNVRERARGGKGAKEKRAVLTVEDLAAAMQEYGTNVKKPDYYV